MAPSIATGTQKSLVISLERAGLHRRRVARAPAPSRTPSSASSTLRRVRGRRPGDADWPAGPGALLAGGGWEPVRRGRSRHVLRSSRRTGSVGIGSTFVGATRFSGTWFRGCGSCSVTGSARRRRRRWRRTGRASPTATRPEPSSVAPATGRAGGAGRVVLRIRRGPDGVGPGGHGFSWSVVRSSIFRSASASAVGRRCPADRRPARRRSGRRRSWRCACAPTGQVAARRSRPGTPRKTATVPSSVAPT